MDIVPGYRYYIYSWVLNWGLDELASSFSLASILAAEFSAGWHGFGYCQLTVYTSKWGHGPVFVSRSFQVGANGYLLVGDIFRLKGILWGFLWDFPTIGILLSPLRLKGWADYMRDAGTLTCHIFDGIYG